MTKLKKLSIVLLTVLFSCLGFRNVSAIASISVIVNGNVEGYTNSSITNQHITVSLSDGFNFVDDIVDVLDFDYDNNIKEWFNSPSLQLDFDITNISADSIDITVSGTSASSSSDYIIVTIPSDYIKDYEGDDLSNVESENAKYNILEPIPSAYYNEDSIISGMVGEELVEQYVYIKLNNTDHSISTDIINNYDVDLVDNGLVCRIVELTLDNVLIIKYNGIPTKEDHSDIDITLLADYLSNSDIDLNVEQNNKVVKFDINNKKPKHIVPVTGVE